MNPLDIMKEAYASNYQGSITELIDQTQAEEQQMLVASTPEEQATGLRNSPEGTSMMFPNTNGESFNTVGMKEPIDIQGFDSTGGLVQSYMSVPPGVGELPMGPKVSTVIEQPAQYRTGGYLQAISSRRKP